ncbi:MAG: hypothetical protein N2V78_09565 [Methanophagales archaeon]|nr:hypothetical protein [Methanophagales archaeon]
MKTCYRRTCWIIPEEEFKRNRFKYEGRIKEVWKEEGRLFYIVYRLFRPKNRKGKKQYKTTRKSWKLKEKERNMDSWYDHYPWRPENKVLGKESKKEDEKVMAMVHVGEHFKWITVVCPKCNNRFDLMYEGGNNFRITCPNCRIGMKVRIKYRKR